ncbi:MAG: hypothetical protein Q6354_09540, partial [Candidatus Brocadiales bacterium]|nr:hypothetical protein [Candidatus Brocadiales bacterium]
MVSKRLIIMLSLAGVFLLASCAEEVPLGKAPVAVRKVLLRQLVETPSGYLRGTEEEKMQKMEEISKSFGLDCKYCHTYGVEGFRITGLTNHGEKAQIMMHASVAMGVDCDYCHAKGGELFTAKAIVAKDMFWMSEVMGTTCYYCHDSQKGFTEKGKVSKVMFEMVVQDCTICHEQDGKFTLT